MEFAHDSIGVFSRVWLSGIGRWNEELDRTSMMVMAMVIVVVATIPFHTVSTDL